MRFHVGQKVVCVDPTWGTMNHPLTTERLRQRAERAERAERAVAAAVSKGEG